MDGDVHAEFGDVYVNAPVKGDVDVGHGDVDLGPDAEISGDLECESGEITGNRSAVKGDMMAKGYGDRLRRVPRAGRYSASSAGSSRRSRSRPAPCWPPCLRHGPLAAAARRVEETPGRAFVYGLVSLPVFFVLCVVLAVSIIGIPLLLLLAPAYLALLFLGALVAAFFIGTRILDVHGTLQGRQRHGRRGGGPDPRR